MIAVGCALVAASPVSAQQLIIVNRPQDCPNGLVAESISGGQFSCVQSNLPVAPPISQVKQPPSQLRPKDDLPDFLKTRRTEDEVGEDYWDKIYAKMAGWGLNSEQMNFLLPPGSNASGLFTVRISALLRCRPRIPSCNAGRSLWSSPHERILL